VKKGGERGVGGAFICLWSPGSHLGVRLMPTAPPHHTAPPCSLPAHHARALRARPAGWVGQRRTRAVGARAPLPSRPACTRAHGHARAAWSRGSAPPPAPAPTPTPAPPPAPAPTGHLWQAVLRAGGGRVELRRHPVRAAVRLAAL